MRLIKSSLIGLVGGLMYGFISFYLLSPYLRDNIVGLIGWAVQGLLLGLIFSIIDLLVQRKNIMLIGLCKINILIGVISGAISSCLEIALTLYNLYGNKNSIVNDKVFKDVFFASLYYFIGSALIGLTVGCFIFIGRKRGQATF
ncbi:MAG: hypothetical protein GJT30_12355 [Geobacter sp.]|nr:hypothetical protein [Geobacter sp.]